MASHEVDYLLIGGGLAAANCARWLREERPVVEELADGAVVVELPFQGMAWLVREILHVDGGIAAAG